MPLLDRHVDHERALRNVGAAVEEAANEQITLIGKPPSTAFGVGTDFEAGR